MFCTIVLNSSPNRNCFKPNDLQDVAFEFNVAASHGTVVLADNYLDDGLNLPADWQTTNFVLLPCP